MSRQSPELGADHGFTVLELIVSLLLLALLLVMLPATLRLGQRVWMAGDQSTRHHATAVLIDRVRQTLMEARPVFERDGSGGLRLVFEGAAMRISYLAAADAGTARAGIYRFEVGALPDAANATGLTFRQRPHAVALAVPGGLVARTLGGSRITFRYWGPQPDGPSAWSQTWLDRRRLPQLVEMTVRSTDAVGEVVVRHVVPLHLSPRS